MTDLYDLMQDLFCGRVYSELLDGTPIVICNGPSGHEGYHHCEWVDDDGVVNSFSWPQR